MREYIEQLIRRRSVGWLMAGMDEAQGPVFVHDEVAAELGGIVAVRIKKLSALEPAFDVQPHHARMMGAQV